MQVNNKVNGPSSRAHLEGVISIACDSLVDRQQEEIQPVMIPLVQRLHDISQHRRIYMKLNLHPFTHCSGQMDMNKYTFAARRANSYAIAWLEELCFDDGVMHLGLKDIEEAVFANLLPSLGTSEHRPSIAAERAVPRRHCESK